MLKSSVSLLLLSSAFISLPASGSFDSLPDELAAEILWRLTPESAAAAEGTCRRFQGVINDRASRGFFLSPENEASLEEIVGPGRVQQVFNRRGYHKLAMLSNRIRLQPANILSTEFKKSLSSSAISDQNKLAIAANAARLFPEEMNSSSRITIIEAFTNIAPEQIALRAQAIEQNSKALFTENMHSHDLDLIITVFAKIAPEQIALRAQAIEANARRLFTADMNSYPRALIISTFAKIDPEQIAQRAQAIFANSKILLTPDMKGDSRAEIIAAFAKIAPEEITARAQAIEKNSKILRTANMKGDYRAHVIANFSRLEPDQISAIAKNSEILFPADMSAFHRGIIIADYAHYAHLDPEQIAARAQAIKANSKRLFTDDIKGDSRAEIIAASYRLEPKQIKDLHFEDTQSFQDRIEYIHRLAKAIDHAFPTQEARL